VPTKYFDQFEESELVLPKVTEGDLDDLPAAGVRMARPEGDHAKVLKHKQWKKAVHGYLASIAFADHQVGRVIDALDKSPHAKNTIIVLWTDHGWHLGEKKHWRKFSLWEEAGRTPLIFIVPKGLTGRLPDGTAVGGRVDRPVGLIDIYPTLVDLCGLSPNSALEGRSLLPLLEDGQARWLRPVLTTHGRGNHALRTPRWRYIRYADGSEEFYDQKSDPNEWTNLAGDAKHANVKRRIAKWLPNKNAPNSAFRKN